MVDVAQVWRALDQVLDPELDQSIVRLGFVAEVATAAGMVTVRLRLPTYWCSPSFAYLMADDARRRLRQLPGVEQVAVVLEDHFAAREITAGVNTGCAFREIFPAEAEDDLEALREVFLKKGFLSRQLVLIQALRRAGLTDEEISTLRLRDVAWSEGQYWVAGRDGWRVVRPASAVERYLVRREEVMGETDGAAPLIVDLTGQPLPGEKLSAYLRQVRATVVNLRASAALCEALLASRQQWDNAMGKEVRG